MNIRNFNTINKNKAERVLKDLLESEQSTNQFQNQVPNSISKNIETSKIEKILSTKSKQFKLDCGVSMASINEQINSKFGLSWHVYNTTNIDDFISSVSQFIEASGNKLSDTDVTKLRKIYNKFKG